MKFTLFYRGAIKTNRKARPEILTTLRRAFHEQLIQLWSLPPLNLNEDGMWKDWNTPPFPQNCTKDKKFIWLVSGDLKMYVNLTIRLYTRLTKGNTSKGLQDIDNKLKIIGDALQRPHRKPRKNDPQLLYLLSDDKLIYKLKVTTDYILEDGIFTEVNEGKSKLMHKDANICIIEVKIKWNRFVEGFKQTGNL